VSELTVIFISVIDRIQCFDYIQWRHAKFSFLFSFQNVISTTFVLQTIILQVSISQAFYQHLFLYKSPLRSFSLITVWPCNFFCQNDIGAKAARKMLSKLNSDEDSSESVKIKNSLNEEDPYERIVRGNLQLIEKQKVVWFLWRHAHANFSVKPSWQALNLWPLLTSCRCSKVALFNENWKWNYVQRPLSSEPYICDRCWQVVVVQR